MQEAYEEAYGETLDLDSPEMVESDVDVPMVDEPAPGMEDVVHHWEIAQKTLMTSKELHEKSKTVSGMGHPYVVPSVWESPELYDRWKLLATCGKQAVLSPQRPGVLEGRASSKEGRKGVFQQAAFGRSRSFV